MSKLDAKVFSSITPFSKQWILGEETMYEFLYNYQDFLSDKYGIVDLGSLTWTYRPSGGAIRNSTFQSVTLKDIVKRTSGVADAYCSKYAIASWNQVAFQEFDKVISIASDGFINVGDSDAGTDPAAFKAAMNGVYLIFRLANNVKRNVFMFNKDNQSHITYYGIYGGLQTFYIDLDSTLHKTDYLLEANNDNWQPTANQDETDHSYRLQAIGEQVNPNRCYVFVTADGEAAAREIINNDPVIIYCYYK